MISIYKSSAGSGKTFTLVLEYLKLVLPQPRRFRSILAVTFTNKATGEMKLRILQTLSDLASLPPERLRSNGYFQLLREHFDQQGDTRLDIARQARLTLEAILNDYSSFAVSTIESFFQRVVRAFARELDLPLGYEIEMQQELVLEMLVDALLETAGSPGHEQLTQLLTDFISSRMEEDQDWKIERQITDLGGELFKERYQRIVALIGEARPGEVLAYIRQLRSLIKSAEQEMTAMAQEAQDLMRRFGVSEGDFSYGSSGAAAFFRKILDKRDFKPSVRVLGVVADPDAWLKAADRKRAGLPARQALDAGLHSLTVRLVERHQRDAGAYEAAQIILPQLYGFGVLQALQEQLAAYRIEHSRMMISDTGELLRRVIEATDEDAPFIYEKVGIRFHHFLLDEFQDTSDVQWANLLPLVREGLANGNASLIVGDVKQSIYRWRNGNMRLLMYQVEQQLQASGFAPEIRLLGTNYRTAGEIVHFNNRLFGDAAALIGGFFGEEGRLRLEQAYGQVAQEARHAGRPGYVEIQWFDEKSESSGEDAGMHWRELALQRTCGLIREICADGFRGGDITLLVRTNSDGIALAVALQEEGIKVVSAESLLLRSHPAVQLLLAVLEYLRDPQAPLPAAAIAQYHGLLAGNGPHPPAFHEPLALPAWLTLNADRLLRMPVHSCLMEIIRLEPAIPGSDAYVQGLLEAALEYTGARDPGIAGFLEWWTDQAGMRAIAASPDPDAVQIMTIHKAKGLEFPVVILPFAHWQLGVSSRELVWADASETGSPFPRLPVRMTSSLEKTVFAPVYAQEQLDSYLDNLNLLYVACTRPEYRLYVLSAFRGKPAKEAQCPARAGELLRQVLCPDAGAEGAVLRFGAPVPWAEIRAQTGAEERERSAPLELRPRTAGRQPWQQRIRVRTLSGRFLGEALLDQQQRIQAGELLHAALARIRTAQDLPAALDFLRMQGLADAEALPALGRRLEQILGSEQVQDWFSGGWEVRNEAGLIRPDGSVLRPDRVMIRGQEAVVVDYKTGAPRPSHVRQVQAYLDAVQEAGFPQVSGYLYYLGLDTLVPVGADRLF